MADGESLAAYGSEGKQMTAPDWQRLKMVFSEALERQGEERDRFVDAACAGDPDLLAAVRRLLEENGQISDFMAEPAAVPLLEEEPLLLFDAGRILAERFRILRFLARGGMGEVYEAEDLLVGERVALKIIGRRQSGDQELGRLRQEIQSARRVTHPNICRTFDVAEHDDPPLTLFTMELLEGPTLSQYMREHKPFTRSEALPLIRQIAAGLQAAHDAGIIHRDFKAGNVILTGSPGSWRPVITDFGLALSAHAGVQATPLRGGTPGYMAPEQLEGGPVTLAVDVYALGVVISRMIGARRPADSKRTPSEPGPFPDAAEELRLLGPWKRIVERCLEKDPARRYQRPAEVAEALAAVTGPVRRKKLLRTFAWAALALFAAIGVWYVVTLRLGQTGRETVTATAMVRHQIPLQKDDLAWQLSPDGRLLILTEFVSTGPAYRLVSLDIASGRRRVVLDVKGPVKESVSSPSRALMSPEGDRLVYMMRRGDMINQLHSVRIDGSDDRLIYADPEGRSPLPLDWSPDGKSILARFDRDDGMYQYVVMSAEDGATIHETPPRKTPLGRAMFHRDGRQIVYESWQEGTLNNWDILQFDPGTGISSPLLKHPANELLIGWTKDRNHLLFMSNRSGSNGLWELPISGDGLAGEAKPVVLDLGPISPISLSRSGSFLYSVSKAFSGVYTAEIVVDAARLVTGPKRVDWPFEGSIIFPGWSADGAILSFLVRGSNTTTLGFLSKKTGAIRRAVFPGFGLVRPQWLGDAGWLVGVGVDAKGIQGFYRVNPDTGQSLLVMDAQKMGSPWEGIWSRDGKIHFNRYGNFRKGLFRLNLETGERATLYVPPAGENLGRENLALSPDERTLAFQIFSMETKTRKLMVMPAAGGATEPLWTVYYPEEFWYGSFAWSRDGRYILAVRTREGKSELWRVPVDGSAPVKFDFPEIPMLVQMRMNPDGRTIAFVAGTNEMQEVWILDHFLQNITGRRD